METGNVQQMENMKHKNDKFETGITVAEWLMIFSSLWY